MDKTITKCSTQYGMSKTCTDIELIKKASKICVFK